MQIFHFEWHIFHRSITTVIGGGTHMRLTLSEGAELVADGAERLVL